MLRSGLIPLVGALLVTLAGGPAAAQPERQLVIAFDTSIAATYLDPAEVAGLQTPFAFLYALHDALVKPLPGNDMAPCLAESWSVSPDGLTYEFKLRERVMHAPIYEPATVHGIGPRVAEAGVGLKTLLYFTAPYEDLRLRKPSRVRSSG